MGCRSMDKATVSLLMMLFLEEPSNVLQSLGSRWSRCFGLRTPCSGLNDVAHSSFPAKVNSYRCLLRFLLVKDVTAECWNSGFQRLFSMSGCEKERGSESERERGKRKKEREGGGGSFYRNGNETDTINTAGIKIDRNGFQQELQEGRLDSQGTNLMI